MLPKRQIRSANVSAASEAFVAFDAPPLDMPAAAYPLAVAVSGGADSMALLLLATDWAKKNHVPIHALTVDHGLRPESAAEAKKVQAWCSQLGITHHTIKIKSPHFSVHSKVTQEQARVARYELLAAWCEKHHVPYLLTAHHRDDQAETLFFRLARGSGLDGLACMQPSKKITPDVTLIRPLLAVSKQRLVQFLQAREQPWIEDPSNQNPRYTRNRIRALLARNQNPEDICERAWRVTQTFATLRQKIEQNVAQKMAACSTCNPNGSILINYSQFIEFEKEYGERIIVEIVKKIVPREHNPRTGKLTRFYTQLCADIQNGKTVKRTFCHCLFRINARQKTVSVTPETA